MHPGSPRASKHLSSITAYPGRGWGASAGASHSSNPAKPQGLPSETGADALGFAIFSLTLQTPKWTPWAGGGVPMKRMA